LKIKPEFRIADVEAARAVVREHPFATIVSRDLRMTRMPCLVEDDGPGLAIVSHVACADPVAERLDGPLLFIFAGPDGYISASWYEQDTIPTWNNVTLQVRGSPERFADALPVLRRTVEHFESRVEHPWSLDRMGTTARELADQVIAFRLAAADWHLEAKLSQDKPARERERLVERLRGTGAYANRTLARAMQRWSP
jgi:transcriptional regulator